MSAQPESPEQLPVGQPVLSARADLRVLGYLGRALSMELSAVQLYATQARLVSTWGLAEPAEKLRAEADEEMGHADRLIARMLALGAAPNASQLRPVKLGRDLRELLLNDQLFELELVQLYSDAVRYCAHAGLHDDRLLFQGLLEEEQAHARDLAEWLAKLGWTPPEQQSETRTRRRQPPAARIRRRGYQR